MILMGVLMFTGKMNAVTGYLSKISGTQTESGTGKEEKEKTENSSNSVGKIEKEEETKNKEIVPAIDFALTDQYGKEHRLSDYKGKTVFLNFWATWCPPCKAEMPDIQKIYETYDTEGEDALVVLGIASPNISGESSEEEIKSFLEENGYTYPVLMDTTGEIFEAYGISSFPTTFMIDRDGNVYGYVSGMLSEDVMQSIIKQTMEGKR